MIVLHSVDLNRNSRQWFSIPELRLCGGIPREFCVIDLGCCQGSRFVVFVWILFCFWK